MTLEGVGGVDGWCYLGVPGVSREPLDEGGVVLTGQLRHQHAHRLGAVATVLVLLHHLSRSNFIRTARVDVLIKSHNLDLSDRCKQERIWIYLLGVNSSESGYI